MKGVQTFTNEEFGTIRNIDIDGEFWFVGKDIAVALGYSNPTKAVIDHVDLEDKQSVMLEIAQSQNGTLPQKSRGQTKTTIINESGLYSLILQSKLPSAKKFKRWVTSEVLPAIRRQGSYAVTTYENIDVKERIQMARIVAFAPTSRLKAVKEILEPCIGELDIEEERPTKKTLVTDSTAIFSTVNELLVDEQAVVKSCDGAYALDKGIFKEAMERNGFTYDQALRVLDEAGNIKRDSQGKKTCPVFTGGSHVRCIIYKV